MIINHILLCYVQQLIMAEVSLALATLLLYLSLLSFITSGDVDIFQSDDTGLVKSTLQYSLLS